MLRGAHSTCTSTACLNLRHSVLLLASLLIVSHSSTADSDLAEVRLHQHTRKPLIRDIPGGDSAQPGAKCSNTLQGRWWITDDRGVVCSRDNLVYQTGCCGDGQTHSCETCNLQHKCCMNYERCVSCCLAPQHNASALHLSAFRANDRQETGHWPNAFEYCRGKCRTTSRSTIHENAYLDPYHHCFSSSGKPITPAPPVPPLPGDITVVPGGQGTSCSAACEAWAPRSPCVPAGFASLNDCNRLRETFPCEAGCDAGGGAERPGYVMPSAPKTSRPAICLVANAPVGSPETSSCDSSAASVQRLCPCGPQAPMPVPANATATEESNSSSAEALAVTLDASAADAQQSS